MKYNFSPEPEDFTKNKEKVSELDELLFLMTMKDFVVDKELAKDILGSTVIRFFHCNYDCGEIMIKEFNEWTGRVRNYFFAHIEFMASVNKARDEFLEMEEKELLKQDDD
ncbi:MAG: hypothetical protein AABY22_01065 [Nanoarchaeota archaeon]